MGGQRKVDTDHLNLNLKTTCERIYVKTGYNKAHVRERVKAYHLVLLEEIMKGGSFKIPGIGSFFVKYRSRRRAFNVQKGKVKSIPETMSPTFEFVDGVKKYISKNIEVQKGKSYRPK